MVVVVRLVVVVEVDVLCLVVPEAAFLVSVPVADSLLPPVDVPLLTSLPDEVCLVPDDVDCLLPLVACLVPEVLVPEVVVSLFRVVLVDCLTVPPLEVLLPPELLTRVAEPPPAERVLWYRATPSFLDSGLE